MVKIVKNEQYSLVNNYVFKHNIIFTTSKLANIAAAFL